MLAKKTSKNQLTLPKEVAEKFPGADVVELPAAKSEQRGTVGQEERKVMARNLELVLAKLPPKRCG
jgi:hypothetical protein